MMTNFIVQGALDYEVCLPMTLDSIEEKNIPRQIYAKQDRREISG